MAEDHPARVDATALIVTTMSERLASIETNVKWITRAVLGLYAACGATCVAIFTQVGQHATQVGWHVLSSVA